MSRLAHGLMASLAVCLWSGLAVAQAQEVEPLSPGGRFAVQAYAQASNGWTIRERDRIENRVTDVELGKGGGLGLRIAYDFSRRIGGYAEADLNAEREGVYGSYGAGVLLQVTGRDRWHLGARVGGRVINVVAPLVYGDLGLSGKLFLSPQVALGLDLATAIPLGERTRDTGTHTVKVSSRGGPERLSFGLAWYPGR